MSLEPDFILGPRTALDFGELQQPGRRGTTRLFGTRYRWTGQPRLSNRDVGASTGRAWTGDVPRVANIQTGAPRGGDVAVELVMSGYDFSTEAQDECRARSIQLAELLLQLAKIVPPASFSTGLAVSCVDSLRPQGTQG